MINRLIIRFSITGVRTPLFALTLPVTAVSIVSVIDSSSPTRATNSVAEQEKSRPNQSVFLRLLFLQNPPHHACHTREIHALNLNQRSQLCRLLKKLAHSVR